MQQLLLAQVPVEGGVLHMDEHGLLDGPGMAVNFLVHYVELVRSMGCPVVVLWWCMGEGALKCSFTLSPKDLPGCAMYALGQLRWGHW